MAEAVPQRKENRPQGKVTALPIRADVLPDFLEPRVGGLKCLVEDFEAGRTHVDPPVQAGALLRSRSLTELAWGPMDPSSVERVTCTIMPTSNRSKSPTTALRVK